MNLSAKRLGSARRSILAATVFLTPLIMTSPWLGMDPWHIPKFAFLAVAVVACIGLRVVEWTLGDRDLSSYRSIRVPAGAVAIAMTVSWIFSPYRGWALLGHWARYNGLIPTLLFVALGFLLAEAFAGRQQQLMTIVVASCSLVAVYLVAQAVGIDPIDWPLGPRDDSRFATVGNSNWAGAACAMTLPLALGWVTSGRRRDWFAAAACIALAAGLIASRSEVAMVAGVGGVALGLGLASRRGRTVVAGLAIALALALGIILLVVSTQTSIQLPLRDRSTVSSRGQFWEAAARMTADHPIVGRGPDVFAIDGVHYRTVTNGRTYAFAVATEPHSVFFSYLTSAGILGAIAFLVLLLWVTHRAAVIYRVGPIEASPWIAAATVYFLQSIASIDVVTLRCLLWTVIAGIGASAIPAGKPARAAMRPSSPAAVTLAVACAAGAVALAGLWGYRLVATDMRAHHGLGLISAGRGEQGLDELRRSITPWSQIKYEMTIAVQLGRAALADPEQGAPLIEEMEEHFRFTEEVPDLDSVLDHARILLRWSVTEPGALDRAADLFLLASAIDPTNPYIAVETADALILLDRSHEALAVLEPHRQLQADYPVFWGSLALTEALEGNFQTAEYLAARALAVDSEDHRALEALEVIEDRS